MTKLKELPVKQASGVLLEGESGAWIIELPVALREYQGELEILLGKVFPKPLALPENFPLAQQLSLNWCLKKSREIGIDLNEAWC